MNNTAERQGRRKRSGGTYVPRFAGEVFEHEGNPDDGPTARRLTSEVAWRKEPAAVVSGKLAVN